MGGIKIATIENPWVLISHTNYEYPVYIIRVVKAKKIFTSYIEKKEKLG